MVRRRYVKETTVGDDHTSRSKSTRMLCEGAHADAEVGLAHVWDRSVSPRLMPPPFCGPCKRRSFYGVIQIITGSGSPSIAKREPTLRRSRIGADGLHTRPSTFLPRAIGGRFSVVVRTALSIRSVPLSYTHTHTHRSLHSLSSV